MQQVRIDFDNPGLPQSLGVVEGESQSRIFQAALYKSGAAYTAPAGAVYSIMYRGFGPQNQGWYDTIEDGAGKRAACTVSGNVVTCELARQALRVPGHLTVVLCVSDAKGYMLKSWPIMADVRNDGYEDTGEIEMYFNLAGIAGNYLTQLEKAMTDAEATKNNLISTSTQVQKDIDAKAAAALESIPEEYTELDGSVKQLKEDLDNVNHDTKICLVNDINIDEDNILDDPNDARTLSDIVLKNNMRIVNLEKTLYDKMGYELGTTKENKIEADDLSNELWNKVKASANTIFDYKKYEKQSIVSYLSVGLQILYINGDLDGISKKKSKKLISVLNGVSCDCTLKYQGSSSMAYPKKNYTIKFSQGIKVKDGWGVQTKYCLKANYIDFSHARNIVSARLWGQIVNTRSVIPDWCSSTPNNGAIDGVPIMLVINGEYQGLYTMNIPKDKWMFNMGQGERETILCADSSENLATDFKALATLHGDFEIEYSSDNTEWILPSLNKAIQSVIDGIDIEKYLDIDSVIDYYIFTVLLCGADMTDRNYLLVTFDGIKWFFSAYDMDSVFGNHWTGGYYEKINANPTFESYGNLHKLMGTIKNNYTDRLKTRYEELRNSILSERNVIDEFYNFTCNIPKAVFDYEVKKWCLIPSTETNNINQIIHYYNERCKIVDSEIKNI